jgi:Zn-dependent protease
MNFSELLQVIATYAIPVLFSITLHEAAHGFMAKKLGDDTAWILGRITLNPIPHIDPIGTIIIPLALYILSGGAFVFGYAKPVPVIFGRLRNPKQSMIWVALAGPLCNLLQAIIWQILLYFVVYFNVREPIFFGICQAGVLVNVIMFAFNLFPIPPLDGGRILAGLLPMKQSLIFAKIEPWGFFIVMALVFSNIITTLWMQPLMYCSSVFINGLLSPLAKILGLPI